MGSQRARLALPEQLIREIDAMVGPRGRSAFLVETATAELRKRKMLEFLRSDKVAFKDEDHPEFASGTEAWVRSLREEWETRTQAMEQTPE